jgi:hypothetical protein
MEKMKNVGNSIYTITGYIVPFHVIRRKKLPLQYTMLPRERLPIVPIRCTWHEALFVHYQLTNASENKMALKRG